MNDVTLRVASSALLDVPLFERAPHVHNWMAIIRGMRPEVRGGYDREFCDRAGEPFYYVVSRVAVGDVIEFGADCISLKRGVTRKLPRRAYGVVRSITETELVYAPIPTIQEALAMGRTASRVTRKIVLR